MKKDKNKADKEVNARANSPLTTDHSHPLNTRKEKNKADNKLNARTNSPLTTHHSPYSLPRKIFILPIRLYQLTLSPLLGTHCRHTPSCSQYAIDAIVEWGPVKGIWLGMKRIARCHPWGTSGYDPVPKKEK